jgi:hypothetical protein
MLIGPELHAVDDDDWSALLTRVVAALAPQPTTESRSA